MQNIANFLIRLQTFELRIIIKGDLQSRIKEEEQKQAYSLIHETPIITHLAIRVKRGY